VVASLASRKRRRVNSVKTQPGLLELSSRCSVFASCETRKTAYAFCRRFPKFSPNEKKAEAFLGDYYSDEVRFRPSGFANISGAIDISDEIKNEGDLGARKKLSRSFFFLDTFANSPPYIDVLQRDSLRWLSAHLLRDKRPTLYIYIYLRNIIVIPLNEQFFTRVKKDACLHTRRTF